MKEKANDMKAIILAAGMGSRISADIGMMPKSTLKINGVPLIRKTVLNLQEHGIEVCVCVGYQYELIQNALEGLQVKYYYNPFFDITNNIASLWFAKEEFTRDDVIVMSADIIFSDELIAALIAAKGDLMMIVDKSRINEGDYFFKLSQEGKIQEYGPNIPAKERSCEYVGISKVSINAGKKFVLRLDEMISKGRHQEYFENVYFSFIDDNQLMLTTIDVSGTQWREIDVYDDYQKAIKEFSV